VTDRTDPGGGAGARPPRVLILGVGNILLTDDGFGVHFVNALQGTPLPPNVQVIEAGTVSHQLITLFREVDRLFVIDVVEAGDTPGSIFRFSPGDMAFPSGQRHSLHEISLIDVLRMAELTGGQPETVILAVQPRDITSWSLELSDELKAAIPRVRDLLLGELKAIGAL
jgi:hydrogenase maturation protease